MSSTEEGRSGRFTLSPAQLAVLATRKRRFQTYIESNLEQLTIGEWISFFDDREEVWKFPTYHEAALAARNLGLSGGWFCEQFRGINPPQYEVSLITNDLFVAKAQFHARDKAARLPITYFNALKTETHPVNNVKVDPGSDVCLAKYELVEELDLQFTDVLYITTLGSLGGDCRAWVFNLAMKVDTLVEKFVPVCVPWTGEGRWLLGQTFLSMCEHKWVNNTHVEIRLLH